MLYNGCRLGELLHHLNMGPGIYQGATLPVGLGCFWSDTTPREKFQDVRSVRCSWTRFPATHFGLAMQIAMQRVSVSYSEGFIPSGSWCNQLLSSRFTRRAHGYAFCTHLEKSPKAKAATDPFRAAPSQRQSNCFDGHLKRKVLSSLQCKRGPVHAELSHFRLKQTRFN